MLMVTRLGVSDHDKSCSAGGIGSNSASPNLHRLMLDQRRACHLSAFHSYILIFPA